MTGTARHGLAGRFADADGLVRALAALRAAGYTRVEAHSPLPLAGFGQVLPVRPWPIPLAAAAGFFFGGAVSLGLQVFANLDYPLNVGGRAVLAWPAFSVPALQFAALGAVLAAALAMLALNRLPRLHHPIFAVQGFDAASDDAFFLRIAAADPLFAPDSARMTLEQLGARSIVPVPE